MNAHVDQQIHTVLEKWGILFGALLIGYSFLLPASAQTSPATVEQTAPLVTPSPALSTSPTTAPLNLDSDSVVNEVSKEPPSGDIKKDVLTSAPDAFEQSLLNSANRKKVSGFVEAGGGVGSLPAQHGFKGENITCENAAVGIADEVSKNTQVSLYAQTYTCK